MIRLIVFFMLVQSSVSFADEIQFSNQISFEDMFFKMSVTLKRKYQNLFKQSCEKVDPDSQTKYNCGELPIGEIVNKSTKIISTLKTNDLNVKNVNIPSTHIQVLLNRDQDGQYPMPGNVKIFSQSNQNTSEFFGQDIYVKTVPMGDLIDINICIFSPGVTYKVRSNEILAKVDNELVKIQIDVKGGAFSPSYACRKIKYSISSSNTSVATSFFNPNYIPPSFVINVKGKISTERKKIVSSLVRNEIKHAIINELNSLIPGSGYHKDIDTGFWLSKIHINKVNKELVLVLNHLTSFFKSKNFEDSNLVKLRAKEICINSSKGINKNINCDLFEKMKVSLNSSSENKDCYSHFVRLTSIDKEALPFSFSLRQCKIGINYQITEANPPLKNFYSCVMRQSTTEYNPKRCTSFIK